MLILFNGYKIIAFVFNDFFYNIMLTTLEHEELDMLGFTIAPNIKE